MSHTCKLGSVDRRDFLLLLGAGLVSALGGCSSATNAHQVAATTSTAGKPAVTVPPVSTIVSTTTTTTLPSLPPIPAPRPGAPQVVMSAHGPTKQIALTIDDGYCEECVAGYVAFAARTGIAITFSPNGSFRGIWDRHADRLRPLIAAGQVQIANHTWSHKDLLTISHATIGSEIERNEDWIQKTFGITARPWFRPPYGKHNAGTDQVAASLGYTGILMWNGTLGDATLETPQELMSLAHKWVKEGSILLGHANHPTVLSLFDQLQQLMDERGLQPVTVDTMFGTTRATG